MRTEAIIKFLRNYKKEMERAEQINIIEYCYYDEETETYRRQIIIDYPLKTFRKEEKSGRKDLLYHI